MTNFLQKGEKEMKIFDIIDIIKKSLIFVCLLIFGILLLVLVNGMFNPYSYLYMSIEVVFAMISMMVVLLILALIVKYIGDIVIVALKSNRE